MKELNRSCYSFEILTRNSRQTAALATYGNIECLVALSAQLIKGDILAYLYASAYLDTYLLHYIYLGINDFFAEFV